MLIALEDMLIQGNGSFLRTACGQECTQRDGFPSQVLIDNNLIGRTKTATYTDIENPFRTSVSQIEGGALGRVLENPAGRTADAPLRSTMVGMSIPFDELRMPELASHTGAGDEMSQQERTALAGITLALTAFVFTSMLNYIPTLATELAGGLYEVPNLYDSMGKHLPGAEQMQQLGGRFSNTVKEQMGLLTSRR